MERPSYLKITLIVALAVIATRLPLLWIPIIDVDEAIWAVAARAWIDGGIPYIDFSDNKPLGVMAFMAGLFEIFGSRSMIVVHAATMAVVLATGVAIARLAESLADRRAGFTAALLYALFSTNYVPKVISTNIETLINLPLVLCVLALFAAYRRRAAANIFIAGTLVGLACCFKYQAGSMALCIPVAILVKPPRHGLGAGRIRATASGIALFSLGTAWPFAAMLAYIHSAGSMEGFVSATLSGSMTYISKGSEGLDLARRIAVRFGTFLASSSPLWIFALLRIRGIKSLWRNRPRELFLFVWLAATSLAVFAGWRLYGHYFLLWLPPLCTLAGMGLTRRWTAWGGSGGGTTKRVAVVTTIAVFTIGFALPRYWLSRVNDFTGEDDPFDYVPIAEEAARLTNPGERIFAWGNAPSIYYYSDRLPAYRYAWFDRLTGRHSRPGRVEPAYQGSPEIKREWEIWLFDMERNRPALIIDTSPAALHDAEHYPMEDYPVMIDYMEGRYRRTGSVNGAVIYSREPESR